MTMISAVLRCPGCQVELATDVANNLVCPGCAYRINEIDGIHVPQDAAFNASREMQVRDLQARAYLLHAKFPTQIASFVKWLGSNSAMAGLALDLGCGPGPYTRSLQEAGYQVMAVDFSLASLQINAVTCRSARNPQSSTFVQADLNTLMLKPESVDIVVMADFLQHLGGRAQRERLLHEVFTALKPGGRFYLSFFNMNIKNFLKGDIHGEFAGGDIRYERLTVANVLSAIPNFIQVEQVQPLNIFHSAWLDSLATKLPGAFYLARMSVVTGRKPDPKTMRIG